MDDISETDRPDAGVLLAKMHDGIGWWRFGEHRWGERRAMTEAEDRDRPALQILLVPVTGRNAVERAPDCCSCAATRLSRRRSVAIGLLALLDDIISILDDVSAMTKVAAGKTAGVLGDDLALNAQQLAEVQAERASAFGIGHTRRAAGHCAAGGRARFD